MPHSVRQCGPWANNWPLRRILHLKAQETFAQKTVFIRIKGMMLKRMCEICGTNSRRSISNQRRFGSIHVALCLGLVQCPVCLKLKQVAALLKARSPSTPNVVRAVEADVSMLGWVHHAKVAETFGFETRFKSARKPGATCRDEGWGLHKVLAYRKD